MTAWVRWGPTCDAGMKSKFVFLKPYRCRSKGLEVGLEDKHKQQSRRRAGEQA
jgi:hypothetical protein